MKIKGEILSRSGPVALAVCVAFAACLSDRSSTAPPSGAELCEGAPGPGMVQIRNFAFQPTELRIQPGAQVTWVNCDSEAHTSTADSGAWASGLLARHATFSRTFQQPGRLEYHCEPHPFMKAAVIVE